MLVLLRQIISHCNIIDMYFTFLSTFIFCGGHDSLDFLCFLRFYIMFDMSNIGCFQVSEVNPRANIKYHFEAEKQPEARPSSFAIAQVSTHTILY